jgi:hypothetical protein
VGQASRSQQIHHPEHKLPFPTLQPYETAPGKKCGQTTIASGDCFFAGGRDPDSRVPIVCVFMTGREKSLALGVSIYDM